MLQNTPALEYFICKDIPLVECLYVSSISEQEINRKKPIYGIKFVIPVMEYFI